MEREHEKIISLFNELFLSFAFFYSFTFDFPSFFLLFFVFFIAPVHPLSSAFEEFQFGFSRVSPFSLNYISCAVVDVRELTTAVAWGRAEKLKFKNHTQEWSRQISRRKGKFQFCSLVNSLNHQQQKKWIFLLFCCRKPSCCVPVENSSKLFPVHCRCHDRLRHPNNIHSRFMFTIIINSSALVCCRVFSYYSFFTFFLNSFFAAAENK